MVSPYSGKRPSESLVLGPSVILLTGCVIALAQPEIRSCWEVSRCLMEENQHDSAKAAMNPIVLTQSSDACSPGHGCKDQKRISA